MRPTLQPIIMAGGRSKRFGPGHKGLAVWRGQSLIDRIRDTLSLVLETSQIWVAVGSLSADPKLIAHLQQWEHPLFIEDAPEMEGPAAGLLACARYAANIGQPWVFITACDMPGLSFSMVSRMAAHAQTATPEIQAIVPQTTSPRGPRAEPLCALYRPQALLQVLETAHKARINKLQRILRNIEGLHLLDEEALAEMDPCWATSLMSINQPEDLRELEDRLDQF